MNKRIKEDKELDILLKRAFCEYCTREDEKQPSDDALSEKYPPSEVDRIEYVGRARRKDRASTVMKTLRRAAVIVLTMTSVTFAALMINDNVRAAVVDTFRTWSDGHGVRVSFTGPEDNSGNTSEHKKISEVTFGYVPEGLTLTEGERDAKNPNFRRVEMTEGEFDGFNRLVAVSVFPSDEMDPGFSTETWERVYQTTINGKDAFIVEVESKDGLIRAGGILFGDADVTVSLMGLNVTHEELIKIAENIRW